MIDAAIRRAVPTDASRLSDIAHEAKRFWGYPEDWMTAWKDELTFTAEYITASSVYVADNSADYPVACYALSVVGEFIHLDHFWVAPNHIGKGLGKLLFSHAIETGRALGGHSLLIDSDPNAEAFYEKMGAVRIGRVKTEVGGIERYLPRLLYRLQAVGDCD